MLETNGNHKQTALESRNRQIWSTSGGGSGGRGLAPEAPNPPQPPTLRKT